MKNKTVIFLMADAIINLILGLLLFLYPIGIPHLLGLPDPGDFFYSSILGGVIFGIGIALLIELKGSNQNFRGLGIAGAITINLCGGSVLLFWLVFGSPALSLTGNITLWIVALIVIGIGLLELFSGSWKTSS
jgi:hypothetical protein